MRVDPAAADVDTRFLLANERTLLAWVRTSLTLLAAGVGTLQLVEDRWRVAPGLCLLAVGALSAVVGLVRYRRADQAIRRGTLPSPGHAPSAVAAFIAATALLLTVLSAVTELS